MQSIISARETLGRAAARMFCRIPLARAAAESSPSARNSSAKRRACAPMHFAIGIQYLCGRTKGRPRPSPNQSIARIAECLLSVNDFRSRAPSPRARRPHSLQRRVCRPAAHLRRPSTRCGKVEALVFTFGGAPCGGGGEGERAVPKRNANTHFPIGGRTSDAEPSVCRLLSIRNVRFCEAPRSLSFRFGNGENQFRVVISSSATEGLQFRIFFLCREVTVFSE